MSKTILQQLFDGEIYPSEHIIDDDLESREMNNAIIAEREYFLQMLPEIDRERFQKLNDLYSSSAVHYGGKYFAYGFSLGATILIDVYGEINNLRTTGGE